MATYDWPRALMPQSSQLDVAYNDMEFASIFTNNQQVVSFPGAYWTLSMTMPPLGRDKERQMAVALGHLQGMRNTFRFRDYRYIDPVNAGNAVVDGGSQTGTQMVTRGWLPNRQVLRAGDYVTVNDQMFRVIDDVRSGGDGRAVLPLNMFIRSVPASGMAVNYRDPYVVMRLTSPNNAMRRQVGQAGITLQAREAF